MLAMARIMIIAMKRKGTLNMVSDSHRVMTNRVTGHPQVVVCFADFVNQPGKYSSVDLY